MMGGCIASHRAPNSVDVLPQYVVERTWTTNLPDPDRAPLRGVDFMPDGKRIVSGWRSGIAKMWDISSGKPLLHMDDTPDLNSTVFREACYRGVVVSSDGRTALTGNTTLLTTDPIVPEKSDFDAKLWDLHDGHLLRKFKGEFPFISAVALSPNGRICAVSGEHESFNLWDAEDGHLIHAMSGTGADAEALAFSHNGKWILSCGLPGATLWDIKTGSEKWRFIGEQRTLTSAAFSPDDKTVAVADWGGVVHILNATDGIRKQRIKVGASHCDDIKFSPDGKILAIATTTAVPPPRISLPVKSIIMFVRTDSWTIYARTEPISAQIWSIAFSHDGKRLACAADGRVVVWHAQ